MVMCMMMLGPLQAGEIQVWLINEVIIQIYQQVVIITIVDKHGVDKTIIPFVGMHDEEEQRRGFEHEQPTCD
jgi:hypothetical protein